MPPLPKTWVEDRDTDILVESWSSSAQTIQVRGISDTEQIFHNHTTNSDRSIATSSFSFNSIPRFLTAKASSTGLKRGQCYVKISLRAEGNVIACLMRGYISDTSVLMFPDGHNEAANSGIGFTRVITGTDPAAAAEMSETVPTGALWILKSLRITLVTDANVASRFFTLVFDDGATEFARTSPLGTFTASSTWNITLAINMLLGSSSATSSTAVIPDKILLLAGYRIRSITSGIQAGDNLSAPTYQVEEFINP